MSTGEDPSMTSAGSVTHWIAQLRGGDPAAAERLWQRYFHGLVRQAGRRLRGRPRGGAGAEDVALNAFVSFWRGLVSGRFTRLRDRTDLRRLLAVITTCRAIDQIRWASRQPDLRRAPAQGEASKTDSSVEGSPLEAVVSLEPDPESVARVNEECQRLLDSLPGHSDLRSIAQWKMEGYTNEEIAAKLNCVGRTVERRLRLIRRIWEEEAPS